MEYNKEESIRCLEIANECLAKGDKEKSLKFARKSERLYPSSQAKDLLERINRLGGVPATENGCQFSKTEGVRKRKERAVDGEAPKYTSEQVDDVNRIKKCKDYYEILGIEKDADANEIKRKYRKLALQFHPDKNNAPGAVEAFKAIGNAFSILNDPEKRRKYDLSSPSTRSGSYGNNYNNYEWDYSHGFEPDMTAEQVFNMFFGGGRDFTNSARTEDHGTAHTFRRHHHVNRENWSQLLLQLSPIFVLVVLSIVSMVFVEEQPYSFVQSSKYSEKRVSGDLQVIYYVTSDFSTKYPRNHAKRVDRDVEGVYLGNLRKECLKETSKKGKLLQRATQYNDRRAYAEAENIEMLHCKRLEEIHSR